MTALTPKGQAIAAAMKRQAARLDDPLVTHTAHHEDSFIADAVVFLELAADILQLAGSYPDTVTDIREMYNDLAAEQPEPEPEVRRCMHGKHADVLCERCHSE